MLLYEGRSRFNRHKFRAIITGIKTKSKNSKTGKILQLWLIPDKEFNANSEEKKTVCGDCPLLGNKCYVNTAWAPMQIQNTKYKPVNWNALRGKILRLGAWGEPTLLPLTVIKWLSQTLKGYLGYSHQWSRAWAQPYRKYLMASVESIAGKVHANNLGWKTFRIVRSVSELLPDEILCPASKEYKEKTGKVITCEKCLLCCGNSSRTPKNIAIVGHGGSAVGANIIKYLDIVNGN